MKRASGKWGHIRGMADLFLGFLFPFLSGAQFVLTTNTYTQHFDGLGKVTISNVAGSDFNNVSNTLNGWYFNKSNGNTTLTAGTGSGSTGSVYSFGTAGSNDRTLGSLRSTTVIPSFGFYFINNSTLVISSLQISFTGKTWRIGASGRADRLDFQYSIDATALNNGTWVDVNTLDYQNTASTAASGSVLHSAVVSATLSGLSIGAGSTLFIRWSDADASGSDDGMGIDDFDFTAFSSGSFSSATDYFKSGVSAGSWGAPGSWQSSPDGFNWIIATLSPTSAAASVVILNGHIITIVSNASARLLNINSGARLIHNAGVSLDIINAAGVDFVVNGTYLLNGKQPSFASGATGEIRNGALVEADLDNGGEADDFARNSSVLFKTGAVYLWNAVTAFETNAVTYFNAAGNALEKPVFRVTSTPAVGSANTTTFNGKFESNTANFQFFNGGTKIFRDGLGGTGEVVHAADCGSFKITAADAVIDGSLVLTLHNSTAVTELEIANGAFVTVMNSAVIRVGSSTAPGATLLVNGTIKQVSSNAIDLTNGNLTLNGAIDNGTTGLFKAGTSAASTVTDITIGGSAGGSAGTISFNNGAAYVSSLTINRTGVSGSAALIMGSDLYTSNLALTNGIIATANNLLFFLNENGDGSSLSVEEYNANGSAYKNSYVCTCDASGIPVATVDGTKGFRIGNVGSTEIMFPTGADFIGPNRMSMKNDGPVDDYTVVVAKGDMGNTLFQLFTGNGILRKVRLPQLLQTAARYL